MAGPNDFFAVDVETASRDIASICQIGIVEYRDGNIHREWESLVNPECAFEPRNVSIHGITPPQVAGSPRFGDIADSICNMLEGNVAFCHGNFDSVAIPRALARLGKEVDCLWRSTARIARGTWEHCAKYGAGLSTVCRHFDIALQNHNALSDARAAGTIAALAAREHGVSISDLVAMYLPPLCPPLKIKLLSPNPDGPFFGQRIVFTGDIRRSRKEAEHLALALGFQPTDSMSKKVSLFVVGDRDVAFMQYGEKSWKMKKADELIAKGHTMRYFSESDFEELLRNNLVRDNE